VKPPLPDAEVDLIKMLQKRDRLVGIIAEMKVGPDNPEIKPHVIEMLQDAIVASRKVERDEVVISRRVATWLLEMVEGPGRGRAGRRPSITVALSEVF
jgi:hypothetical protein